MKKASPHSSGKKKALAPLPSIELLPLSGLPEIRQGDDLAGLLVAAARQAQIVFERGDVLVIAQKMVSKAEGLLVRLSSNQIASRGDR